MTSSTYRLKNPLMAVSQEQDTRLVELPAGSMFYSSSGSPDSQGMIKGMCKGQMVLIFASDLEERCEPLAKLA